MGPKSMVFATQSQALGALDDHFLVEWQSPSARSWIDLVAQAPKSNLLQSWAYAQTMRSSQQLMTRFGHVVAKGETVGLVQIQEASIAGLAKVVTLDRGPLWLNDRFGDEHGLDFARWFAATYPKRLGLWRRFMPELAFSEETNTQLTDLGFRPKKPGHRSIWLDLGPDLDTIRTGLKQKWRNALNGAERSKLDVHRDGGPLANHWLLEKYTEDRLKRRYPGPSPQMVRHLITNFGAIGDALTIDASIKGEPVAGILVFKHGRAATYQIGWTSDKGRERKAHHLLLWHAIETLKDDGIDWFDLGGINPDTADGVTKFKQGLGGAEYELVGLFT